MALAAAVLVVPRAASADQQSSVQAQIAALRDRLTTTGQQVHQLTAGYTAAEVQVQSIAEQVAVERVQAERAAADLAQSGAALRQNLVAAYVGGFSQPSGPGDAAAGSAGTGGDIANPSVRYGYLSIATSAMRDSVDSFRTAQLKLNSTLAALSAEERSARVAADSADRARRAALDEAAAANTRLGALQAQLTALEEKAAAQRAAQANQSRPSSAGSTNPVAQGGPVNGGLVSLVRSQVGAAAATSTPAPPPPVPTTPAAPVATTTPAVAAPAVTVAPPTTAPPATVAAPTVAPAPTTSGNVWLQLRQCESGNDYQANTGNGFYGAYQFTQQTWTDLGYPGRPDQEPPAMQDAAAQKLQAESGWGQWPACSAALGLS